MQNKPLGLDTLRAAMRSVPDVIPYLSPRVRRILSEPTPYKTYEFFLSAIEGLVNSLYNGFIGGEFIDVFANLISGQLTDAYSRAWVDDGNMGDLPPYLMESLEGTILNQYTFVDQYYRDIIDARVDGTPIKPMLDRAELWAQRWNESYEMARHLITIENGGKEVWIIDPSKENCTICAALNGIVAYAREWDELNVHPRNAPNPILAKERGGCGGWKCGCERKPTDRRRSPRAYDTILNIVTRGSL